MLPTLVGTWRDGLFALDERGRTQHFAGQTVPALARDAQGAALAIVGEHALWRLEPDGRWHRLAEVQAPLCCCVATREAIYLGTDDARLFRLEPPRQAEPLDAFERVPGRERWYSGAAMIDGRMLGPPLGVRSLTATCDGRVLLANVHVGGIPRSTDGGASWHATIDIDADVHHVCAHPSCAELVVAAAAAGLCTSEDAGATWRIESQGLHAPYCAAVACAADAVLITAAAGHFAPQGALYRRQLRSAQPLQRVRGGLPDWLGGIVDTHCLACDSERAVLVDRTGMLFWSDDAGEHWHPGQQGLPAPSSVLLS